MLSFLSYCWSLNFLNHALWPAVVGRRVNQICVPRISFGSVVEAPRYGPSIHFTLTWILRSVLEAPGNSIDKPPILPLHPFGYHCWCVKACRAMAWLGPYVLLEKIKVEEKKMSIEMTWLQSYTWFGNKVVYIYCSINQIVVAHCPVWL